MTKTKNLIEDESVMELAQSRLEKVTKAIIKMHKFVIKEIEIEKVLRLTD